MCSLIKGPADQPPPREATLVEPFPAQEEWVEVNGIKCVVMAGRGQALG